MELQQLIKNKYLHLKLYKHVFTSILYYKHILYLNTTILYLITTII